MAHRRSRHSFLPVRLRRGNLQPRNRNPKRSNAFIANCVKIPALSHAASCMSATRAHAQLRMKAEKRRFRSEPRRDALPGIAEKHYVIALSDVEFPPGSVPTFPQSFNFPSRLRESLLHHKL